DVAEEEVDRVGIPRRQFQRHAAVRSLQHHVAGLLQYVPDIGANPFLVFGDENRFAPALRDAGARRFDGFGCGIEGWKADLKHTPAARLADNRNSATALPDDSVHRGKAKPGSLARLLGGKKRLENSLLDLGSHALPFVTHD